MRKEEWRREPANYDSRAQHSTRYADIDLWRHVNNVAAGTLHQEARMRWLREHVHENVWFSDGVLLRPALIATDFLAEGRYPGDILAAARCTEVTSEGLGLGSALFQQGACIGLQQTWLRGWCDGRPAALPEDVAQALARHAVAPVAVQSVPADVAPAAHGPLPWDIALPSRFSDSDGDEVMGEIAIARLMEQARISAMRRAMPGFHEGMVQSGLGIVVAHTTVRHLQHRRAVPVWQARVGVARVGSSSFTIRAALYRREECVAVADSVLVIVDRRATRPAGLPAASREALEAALAMQAALPG